MSVYFQWQLTVEWILCSPHFEDIILIAPKGLNDIPPLHPSIKKSPQTNPTEVLWSAMPQKSLITRKGYYITHHLETKDSKINVWMNKDLFSL